MMMKLIQMASMKSTLMAGVHKLRRHIAVIMLLVTASNAYAQFPVQVTPQLIGPYTVFLSDFYTGTNPKLYVTLTNADLVRPVLNVRLRMSITGQLVSMRTKDNVPYPSISLNAGIPLRLSLNDLAPYFNPDNLDFQGMTRAQFLQQGKLPEGFYEFCFEAIEQNTGLVVSKKECAIASISLSDPPLLNLPAKASIVEFFDPTNILFTWTPRNLSSPNSAYSTVYDFQLVELRDPNVSPEVALRTTQPLYQVTTPGTVLLYGPAQPLLIPGKRYGWRVRARNTNGVQDQDIFRNNGYSEVYWFDYREICHEPSNVNAVPQANGNVLISWAPQNKSFEYILEYRNNQQLNAPWQRVSVNATTYIITDGVRGEAYTYRVGNRCKLNGEISYSTDKTFTVVPLPVNPNAATGKIAWAYRLTEETVDPSTDQLVSRTKLPESVSVNSLDNTAGNTRYPLKNASVSIYGAFRTYNYTFWGATSTVTNRLLGTGTTDASGNYNFVIDPTLAATTTNHYIEITHPTGLFSKIKRNVTLARTANGYSMGNDILVAQSFELKPSVFIPNYVAGNAVSVDVLMNATNWNQYSFLQYAGLGNSGNTLTYNQQQYVLLTTLTDGKAFKKLFYNENASQNYVVRVNYQNKTSVFYPLSAFTATSDQNGFKPLQLYKRTFGYVIRNGIQGVISLGNTPRRDVRVDIRLSPADILGDDTTTLYTAMSDAQGNYGNYMLPPLKSGAVIKLYLTDRTLRNASFYEEAVFRDSTLIIKNISLENKVYTITGKLLDQDNQPIPNALVTVKGSSESVRTTTGGIYMLKVYGNDPVELSYTVDGYDTRSKVFAPSPAWNIYTDSRVFSLSDWTTAIKQTRSIASILPMLPGNEVTADILGIGTGSLQSVFNTYFNSTESLKGVIDADTVKVPLRKGLLSLSVKLNGRLVKANVRFSNGYSAVTTADSVYRQPFVQGHYVMDITTFPGESPFVPFKGEFDIYADNPGVNNMTLWNYTPATVTSVTVNLTRGVFVQGYIKDKANNAPVDSALVEVTGMPYNTVSDSAGNYKLIVPLGQQFQFNISQRFYNSMDTTFFTQSTNTANFVLEKRDPNMFQIATLAGFPVTIDKQVPGGSGAFVISGKLLLGSNDIFSPDSLFKKLTFKNISVKPDTDPGNVLPLADVEFEEAVIKAKAFGFVPVEVRGLPQITMKGLTGRSQGSITNWKRTVIGGTRVIAKFSTIQDSTSVPFKMADADLKSNDTTQLNLDSVRNSIGLPNFAYVFTAPNYKINALGPDQSFSMKFILPDTIIEKALFSKVDPIDTNYIKAKLGYVLNLFVDRKNARLDKRGLSLNGFIQMPKLVACLFPDSGRIMVDSFQINRQMQIAQLSLLVSKTKPKIVKLQKIIAKLTKVNLYGLGSPNFGIGFGGNIILKKSKVVMNSSGDEDTLQTLNNSDTLTINYLSIINKPEGLTLAGSFSLDSNGFSMKSLVFTTPGRSAITMTYNTSSQGFLIEAAGMLNYNKNRSATTTQSDAGSNSALGSVFPIEIQYFQLNTKDWSLFLAAKANIKIDLKVAKINIERFLVNVGYGMTLDAMNTYLVSGTNQSSSVGTGGPEQMLEESRASWAFGISGGIEFPIRSITTNIRAALLVGNINNKIEVRLDSISLEIANPSFSLKASVAISFSGTRQGFEGSASLTTLSKSFAASFKYYSISASPGVAAGIELGASIKVNANITTGPVQWFSIGGGFDFNTSAQTYKVFLTGDIGMAATPKEVGYVKDAYISVLFDINKCGGIPIVEGGGTVMMKQKIWGAVTMKIDFCNTLLLVTVKSTVEAAPGINVFITGVLYGMVEKVNGVDKGSLFVGVNANITSMGDMLKGNIFLAVGASYNNNNPLSPQDVKNLWGNIDYEAKDNNGTVFNGVFISGTMGVPAKTGSFNVSIASFPLFGFNYSFSANATIKLYVKFSNDQFKASAAVNANASADLSVFGYKVYGSGYLNLNLTGGYDGSWYVNGNARLGLELYNKPGAGCNSFSVNWTSCCCTSIPYPCGMRRWFKIKWCHKDVCIPYPEYTFKVCKSLSASFSYRQGQGTNVSFDLF